MTINISYPMKRWAFTLALPILGLSLNAQDDTLLETENVFELDPFTVSAEEDTGYLATSTLAGTRLKTSLKDVGSAISVVTAEFIEDTGVVDNESLLVYTTSSETGGVQGNYAGLGNGEDLDEGAAMLRPNSNNRIRGLASADNTRDFMLTDIPWDSYNVDRIDLQRGPNAILFGLGSPAGIINATVSEAAFADSGKVEFRFGSFGTLRLSANYNQVILEDELAIRVAGLMNQKRYEQEEAFTDDDRYFVALKYEPRFLQSDQTRTIIKFNYEKGDITANSPRTIPPGDQITPWFENMGQQVFNPLEAYNENENIPGSGSYVSGSANYNPYLNQLYGGNQAYFGNPNSGIIDALTVGEWNMTQAWAIGPDGSIDEDVQNLPFYRSVAIADYATYAFQAGLPYSSTLDPYKRKSLTDRSIFDFKKHLIDGPNKREWRNFDVTNAKLEQTFFNNRVGYQLTYDRQNYEDRSFRPFGSNPALSVDINTHLPLDLSPNPNVGRPYIYSRTRYGNGGRQTEREVTQATVFAELKFSDFMDETNWLTRLLGRHIFTGFGSKQEIQQSDQQWSAYIMDREFGEYQGATGITAAERELMMISHLGPSMFDVSSPSGLNIQPISAVQDPSQAGSIRIFDSHWNSSVDPSAEWIRAWDGEVLTQSENAANYVGYTSMPFSVLDGSTTEGGKLSIQSANRQFDEIESTAFIWQAYFWDDAIVATYGYRKDTADTYSVNLNSTDRAIDIDDGSYVVSDEPTNSVSGETNSYSLVLHTDRFLPDLPMGTTVSLFYNESSNFQPAAGRLDVFAQPLDAPSGETTDYGFVISTMNGKVNFKVNWYETLVKDATYDPGGIWVIGAQEARAMRAAQQFEANLNGEPGAANWYYRPRNGQTEAEALAEQRLHVDAVLGNQVSQEFYDAWGMDPVNGWKSDWWLGGAQPSGITSTADRTSKGVEFELNVNPTKNWTILLNAAKQTAKNENLAGSLREFIDERNAHWNGPAGDIRMWWGGGGDSILSQWNRLFYSKYLLALQLEGTNVAELRPWRFNAVSTYRFSKGRLKGLSVGGSVRWEDKVAIGYPVITDSEGSEKFDIDNPHWGPSRSNVDLWLGYSRKLTDKIDYRIQLNVKNAFADDDLIPISVQQDGSPGTYRIPNSREWFITNTFSF